ncbi:PREDICTED: uncharacterized protein LOC105973352 [Erythranthe guttata]|uniref:uncharacterized protein LOC105973352 n=1 Tax=Erythranthe guttata TaxID=4155 RepID=UPI00064DCF1D|nr:PREDICTED: uncharacterized protein LOC105973352 [Erythranthe guttata]|eukprot:XP_012853828.1 PREDICTED: uncharacterized protein LOC105973352 [Erythranthe guttata]
MGKNRSAEGSKKRRHTPSASPAEKKSRKSSKKVRPTVVEISPVPVTTDLDPVPSPVASPSPSLKTSDVPDPVDTGVAVLDGDSLSGTPQDDLPSDPEVAPRSVEFPVQLLPPCLKVNNPLLLSLFLRMTLCVLNPLIHLWALNSLLVTVSLLSSIPLLLKKIGIVSSKPSVSKDTLASVLTAKVLKKWPGPKSVFHVSKLTQLYSVLFKIGISNWFPTTHNATLNPTQAEFLWCITHDLKINIGELIFTQIGALANSRTEREHLPFPSLIYQLLIKQGLPTRDATLLDPPGRPITIHGKVLSEHFADLPPVDPTVVQTVPRVKKAPIVAASVPIVAASIPPPVDVVTKDELTRFQESIQAQLAQGFASIQDQLLRTLAHSGQKGGVATTPTPAASTKTKDKGKKQASLLTPPQPSSRDDDDLFSGFSY